MRGKIDAYAHKYENNLIMEIALILFVYNKETRGLGKLFIGYVSLSSKGEEVFAFYFSFFTFKEKIHLEKIEESSVAN